MPLHTGYFHQPCRLPSAAAPPINPNQVLASLRGEVAALERLREALHAGEGGRAE